MKKVATSLVLLLLLSACVKKNYTFPPAPTAPPAIKHIYLDHTNYFDLAIDKMQEVGQETVKLSLTNNAEKDIDSAILLLEIFKSKPYIIPNLVEYKLIHVPQIKKDATVEDLDIIRDKNIIADTALFNVQVIRVNFADQQVLTHTHAGKYTNMSVEFGKRGVNTKQELNVIDSVKVPDTSTIAPDDSITYYKFDIVTTSDTVNEVSSYGSMTGYVAANGSFVFRLLANGSTSYTISGIFPNDTTIANTVLMDSEGKILSTIMPAKPLNNQPSIISNGREIRLSLELKTPLGNEDNYIHIHAIKD